MKNVGILGGTFDPIHNGHIMLAMAACEQFDLDAVAIMPTGVSPHKGKIRETTVENRVDMVSLAIEDKDKLFLSREEIDSTDEVCFTYNTLTRLKEKNKDTNYYFILGGDSLKDFKLWRHPEIICEKAAILAAIRDDIDGEIYDSYIEEIKYLFSADIRPLRTKNYHVSSHDIRDAIKAGQDVSDVINKKVYDYIKKNGIYGYKGN
jgi:nicotinate-nucleotide adenylyltransferase